MFWVRTTGMVMSNAADTKSSESDILNKLGAKKKKKIALLSANVAVPLAKSRALHWAVKNHVNTRLERMSFKNLPYLSELYRIIGSTPYMCVEKSVQCFPGESQVVTPYGYVPINRLRVGELVLTHLGRYRKINKVYSRKYTGSVVEQRADLLPCVISTQEHPFLTFPYPRYRYHNSRYGEVFGCDPVWESALKVRRGDFVCRAKIPHSTGARKTIDVSHRIDRPIVMDDGEWFREKWGQRDTIKTIALDYGFGQLVGLYLSEGWINDTRLCFGFHFNASDLEAIVYREIAGLYKGKCPLHTYVSSKDSCRRVFVSSHALAVLFSTLFGDGCGSKGLPPAWISDAPVEFLRGVFDGSMLGDGYVTSGAQSSYRTVSMKLANQMRFIGGMLGRYGVIRKEHPPGKRCVYSFVFSNPKNRRYTRLVDTGAYVGSRLREHSERQYAGTVFNLEVEDDHSYVVEDYVVHNCGLSELFIVQSHIEAGELGMTIMYVLPKYELRNRFVNNRIYKLHKRAPAYNNLIAAAETKVHRTSLMHFGSGTLAYVGSNVQDEFIEIPVDSAYIDEKDRCNLANLLMLPDRLTASPYKFEREISNPTVEGFGIDERYVESSQGTWNIKCPRCGKWFTPDFWKHVVEEVSTNTFVPRDTDADPDRLVADEIRIIHDCGCAVDRLADGEWIHAYPNRQWQGFRVSKTFSKFTTMRQLYRKWVGSVGNNLKTQIFYNSDLGLPFSSKGSKITRAMLNDCRRKYEWPVRRVGQENARIMGVDVGKYLHVLMRERVRIEGGVKLRLIGLWILPGFSQLVQLLREWKPRCVVVDALPEIHKIMDLKASFGSVWSSVFQRGQTAMTKHKDKRELRMDRTALLDFVQQGVELQSLLLPMQAEFLEDGEYYNHMQASTRILEANEEHPEKSRFVWKEGSRPDHFMLAEAYCIQAGMVMPNHDVFEFFEQEAGALKKHGDRRDVTSDGTLSDDEREKIAEMKTLTPEVFLQKTFAENVNVNPPKKEPDDEKIADCVKFMFSSQGYVDVLLAANMAQEPDEDIRRVLDSLGFKESKIEGQYVK